MKKITVLTLLSIFFAVSLHAQRIGIRGGVTVDNSSIGYDNVIKDQKTGFDGGVTLDLGIPLIGWNINTGLSYANRGFSLKYSRGEVAGVTMGETYHFRTHSLEVPVNIRKEFNLVVVKPFIQTGVYGSYILSGKVKDKESSHTIKYEEDSDRFSMGANIGVGCVLISKISVLANYSIGFAKNKYNFGDENVSRRNKGYTFSLGYLF